MKKNFVILTIIIFIMVIIQFNCGKSGDTSSSTTSTTREIAPTLSSTTTTTTTILISLISTSPSNSTWNVLISTSNIVLTFNQAITSIGTISFNDTNMNAFLGTPVLSNGDKTVTFPLLNLSSSDDYFPLPDAKTITVTIGSNFVSSGGTYTGSTFWFNTDGIRTNDYTGLTWNTARFTDNSNGTILDNVTGLMWEKAGSGGLYNWTNSANYCDNQNTGGYSNWRLPDRYELYSLRYTNVSPAWYPNNVTIFTGTAFGYWSSTTYALDTTLAWIVFFNTGNVYSNGETNTCYVRCVRF